MATPQSIAIRQEAALDRLNVAARTLAERYGVDAPDIPTTYREEAELPVMQQEAVADWIEALIEKLPAEPVPNEDAANMEEAELASLPDYTSMTKAELVAEAQQRNIDTSVLKTKPELIDALMASDGLSEDEQAAQMDEGQG